MRWADTSSDESEPEPMPVHQAGLNDGTVGGIKVSGLYFFIQFKVTGVRTERRRGEKNKNDFNFSDHAIAIYSKS